MRKKVESISNIKEQKDWYWKSYDLEDSSLKNEKISNGILPEIKKFEEDCNYSSYFYQKMVHRKKYPVYVCFREDDVPAVMFIVKDHYVNSICFNEYLLDKYDLERAKLELKKKIVSLINETKISDERINRDALEFESYLSKNGSSGKKKKNRRLKMIEEFSKSSSVVSYRMKDGLIYDELGNEVGYVTENGSLVYYDELSKKVRAR